MNIWSSFVMQRATDRGYSSCWLLRTPQSALLMWLISWGWVRRMLQTVCFTIHPFIFFFLVSMWKFYHIQWFFVVCLKFSGVVHFWDILNSILLFFSSLAVNIYWWGGIVLDPITLEKSYICKTINLFNI